MADIDIPCVITNMFTIQFWRHLCPNAPTEGHWVLTALEQLLTSPKQPSYQRW